MTYKISLESGSELQFPSDLKALYQWANERYFDNQLPAVVRCEWNGRFIARSGDFSPFTSDKDRDDYRIRIAKSNQNKPRQALNVMVHEMTHLWQVRQAIELQDDSYLDLHTRTVGRMSVGHGVHFCAKIDDLNRQFEELELDTKEIVSTKAGEEEENSVFYQCIRFDITARGGRKGSLLYYSENDGPDPLNNDLLEDVCADIKIFGARLDAAHSFITSSKAARGFKRITQKGVPKKTKKLGFYKTDLVDSIQRSELTKNIRSCTLGKRQLFINTDDFPPAKEISTEDKSADLYDATPTEQYSNSQRESPTESLPLF